MKKRQVIIIASALGIILASAGLSKFLTTLKEEPEEKKEIVVKKYVKTEAMMITCLFFID